jgi:hypothetical protein
MLAGSFYERFKGRTGRLEHIVSLLCWKCGITSTGSHPCMVTELP